MSEANYMPAKLCSRVIIVLLIGALLTSCSQYSELVRRPPCEQLPTAAAIDQTLAAQEHVRQQIEQINPGFIFIGVDHVEECPNKAVLHIFYATARDREQIKQRIGDTFFGIPYRMQNT